METKRLFLNITWFFATVETEAPVLCSVVMVTMDAIHNTAIGTLEHDWFVKIIHVIYTKKIHSRNLHKDTKKTRNTEYKSRRLYIHKIIIACPQYAV